MKIFQASIFKDTFGVSLRDRISESKGLSRVSDGILQFSSHKINKAHANAPLHASEMREGLKVKQLTSGTGIFVAERKMATRPCMMYTCL